MEVYLGNRIGSNKFQQQKQNHSSFNTTFHHPHHTPPPPAAAEAEAAAEANITRPFLGPPIRHWPF